MQNSPDVEETKLKSVSKTEASVICFVESGAVSVVGYHRTLVSCSSVKKAIVAVMSMYFVCNIEYDAKHKLLMNFIEFVLTGKHVQLAKRATQLIKQLNCSFNSMKYLTELMNDNNCIFYAHLVLNFSSMDAYDV